MIHRTFLVVFIAFLMTAGSYLGNSHSRTLFASAFANFDAWNAPKKLPSSTHPSEIIFYIDGIRYRAIVDDHDVQINQ